MFGESTTFPDLPISMEDEEELLKFLGEVSQHDMEEEAKEKERLVLEKEERRRKKELRKEEEKCLWDERRAAQLAALPEKIRAFVDAGRPYGLSIDTAGNIGGMYRFIYLPHIEANSFGEDEPRPTGLPWIRNDVGLWVAMPTNLTPEHTQAHELQEKRLRPVFDAVWPTDLARHADMAFDELLDEREARRLQKPNFFAPDLYDANCEEPYLVDGENAPTGAGTVPVRLENDNPARVSERKVSRVQSLHSYCTTFH